jgi:hypothetical protein
MPTLAEIRSHYPQYEDLSDRQLAEGLHKAYYSDMPFSDFAGRIGYRSGRSLDLMADGSTVPTESVHYTGSGVVDATSGIAQRQKKYGTTAGFDFSIKPEDVQDVRKGLSPLARGGYNAVTSLPGLAADAGVGLRNMLTGENYQNLTQMTQPGLDKALPMPNIPGDKTLEILTSIATGSQMPFAPSVKNPAPKDFVKPAADLVRQQTLANSQRAGYVVPPATTNPSPGVSFLESLGGKTATAQDAALRNQGITNQLAKRTLGLSEDAPITPEALSALRKEAGTAYSTMRSVGSVALDDASTKTLDDVAAKFTGSKLKEALGGGNDIPKVVQALKDEPLNGDTAVDVIALLRDKADAAFRAGDKQIGKGYKEISTTIENLMERQLSGEALKNFKDARQLIAKTYSVEGALNPSTGNVIGNKLASQLAKGKPISGDLLTAAKFSQAFPKASKEMVDSGAVRHTDAILGSGAAVFTGHPWYLGWPFGRQAVRSFLLSNPGQGMATQGAPASVPPQALMGLLGGQRPVEELLRQ